MQRTLVILAAALFFDPLATSTASPQDSPDVVYIDGQPCNRACQSYMAWSRNVTPVMGQPKRVSIRAAAGQAVAGRVTGIRKPVSKPSAEGRATKLAPPASSEIPRAKTTIVRLMGEATAAAGSARAEISNTRLAADAATADAAGATIKDSRPASNAADVRDTSNAKGADSRPTVGVAPDLATRMTRQQGMAATASSSHERTTQELVTAATALAERMTVATTTSQGAPLASSDDTDPRIAILIARPDIKSVSDLSGKAIAIDDKLFDLSSKIEIAMTAAGATEVRVNEPEGKPSEPVIDGAVPAAVLTLVSREAADAFPEIPGFKIFRIPLTPEAPQEKVVDLQPARAVAAGLDLQATKLAAAKPAVVAVAGDGPAFNSGDGAEKVARLMARASALLAQGNISAARAVLERAAVAGSAQASFTLAETYDPRILPKWRVYATRGDATKAREFYAKAEAGGIKEAKARFEALASVAQ
jgi:hypothetical protein